MAVPANDKSLGVAVVDSTVETFANRIQRKLKEKEVAQDQSQKAMEIRHSLLLRAMTTIRKALQETARIDLGSRFKFNLALDDWEGWPRVQLNLVDALIPSENKHALIIVAHDRNDSGTIRFHMKDGQNLAWVHLKDASELNKLPLILKKSVREFLDLIASYVLNPEKPEDALGHQTKPVESTATQDIDNLEEDVFEEHFLGESDNTIAPLDTTSGRLVLE